MHALRSVCVAWDVYFTAVAEEWILGLDDDNYTAMLAAIELLEVHGPSLGRPAVDRNIPVADDLYDEHLPNLDDED